MTFLATQLLISFCIWNNVDKEFHFFLFFPMQKKLKSEENTIYLFDFEPNIRDFQESI
jgi:hypothetical protein